MITNNNKNNDTKSIRKNRNLSDRHLLKELLLFFGFVRRTKEKVNFKVFRLITFAYRNKWLIDALEHDMN